MANAVTGPAPRAEVAANAAPPAPGIGVEPLYPVDLDPLDPKLIEPVLKAFRAQHPKSPTSRIVTAFEVSAEAHKEQKRKSGEPYITHPVAVALVLAHLGMDDVTLAGALLHDSVASPNSNASTSSRRKRSRPPPCARCSSQWRRTCGSWS
jgi:hypothetical protein